MPKGEKAKICKLTWEDARNDVIKVNPKLAKAIDDLDPGKDLTLVKVRYPFGQHILDQGSLRMPTSDGDWADISDPRVDPSIREMLTYAKTIPIGVVLNNSAELYLEVGDRIIPFSMMHAGKIFALWSALELTASAHLGRVWSITSGARSLIMLPKISDVACHNRVRYEFNLESFAPKKFSDQWNIYAELAKHPNFQESWDVELLFFPNKWLKIKKDVKWKLFRQFLLESAWHDTAFLRNQVVFDFSLSCALASKNLRPNPYLTDTIKHLYAIGVGAYPAFSFAKDNSAGPISALQDIFVDIYGLKYAPSMIHLGYFSPYERTCPSYYSLQSPTLMIFSPRSRKVSSKLDDIREIEHVMKGVSSYILENPLGLENTPIYKWIQNARYDYFHTNPGRYGENIKSSRELLDLDASLQRDLQTYKGLEFCQSSPFVRGCIRISSKEESVEQ